MNMTNNVKTFTRTGRPAPFRRLDLSGRDLESSPSPVSIDHVNADSADIVDPVAGTSSVKGVVVPSSSVSSPGPAVVPPPKVAAVVPVPSSVSVLNPFEKISIVQEAFKAIFGDSVRVFTKTVRCGGTSNHIYVPKRYKSNPVTIIIWPKIDDD